MCTTMDASIGLALLLLVTWMIYAIMRDDSKRYQAAILEAEARGAGRVVAAAMAHPSRAGSDTVERILRDELARINRSAEQARRACGTMH